MALKANFPALLQQYQQVLLESVVPFWLKYGIDREYGGLLTCLSDEGEILAYDKYLWSQLRAIWTFSALYNRIEPRPEFLEIARSTFDFVRHYGRDEQGRWMFCVDRRGKMLQGATSIYTDSFAIYGFTELARATHDPAVIALALETYENVQRRLAVPGSYATDPYPLPDGVKAHGISMVFAIAFHELGHLLNDPAIIEASRFHAGEVMDVYRRPERKMLYEFMQLDNTLLDTPQGRAVVPGHAIESMWFMLHIFQKAGDSDRIRQAIETIRWHVELGWDQTYGGLLLGLDAEGGSPWWRFADSKLWWPHTEALYALLLAYHHSRDDWYLEWHQSIHDYTFTHYPVAQYGEWTQRLNRQGEKFTTTVALPVKDPFHLPRALIYCIELLRTL